jgi:hypothetical protein
MNIDEYEKYIKKYNEENSKKNKKLVIGNIYYHNNYPVCYLGHNGSDFPRLFLILREDHFRKFQFIDWIDSINVVEKEKITINNYILKHNLVRKTIDSFKRKSWASGPADTDSKLIKDMFNNLMSDERIKKAYELEIDTKKYNL